MMATCSPQYYFDSVVGLCSPCSDICEPGRNIMIQCRFYCPGFKHVYYSIDRSTVVTESPTVVLSHSHVLMLAIVFILLIVLILLVSLLLLKLHTRSAASHSCQTSAIEAEQDMLQPSTSRERTSPDGTRSSAMTSCQECEAKRTMVQCSEASDGSATAGVRSKWSRLSGEQLPPNACTVVASLHSDHAHGETEQSLGVEVLSRESISFTDSFNLEFVHSLADDTRRSCS